MKEITCYEAFDGTRFDDEDDCITYEHNHQAKDGINGIILYTKRHEAEIARDWDNLASELDYAEYIYITTNEGYKLFFDVSEYHGYYTKGVDSIMTLYKWNSDKECYEAVIDKLTEELKELVMIQDEMKNFKN